MLKTILYRIAYFTVMLSLGFAIYYFFFAPLIHKQGGEQDYAQIATRTLFEANIADENGVKQALSLYKGKIIVLNFWATWCPPCRDEMPELSQLHTEYQAKNVTVLGIAVDEQKAVKEFIAEHPVSYPLLVSEDDGMALGSALGNSEGILPYTVIIDAQGEVNDIHYGRISKQGLKSSLDALLAQK